jgi:hypothetical protein
MAAEDLVGLHVKCSTFLGAGRRIFLNIRVVSPNLVDATDILTDTTLCVADSPNQLLKMKVPCYYNLHNAFCYARTLSL